MKATPLLIALGTAATLAAQDRPVADQPPAVYTKPAPIESAQVFVYDQKPVAARPVLIAPEQARDLLDRFREAYPKLGSPRFVMYVNRELVDAKSGMRLSGRTERTQRTSTEVNTEFKADPNAPAPASTPSIQNPAAVTIIGDVGGLPSRQYPGSGSVDFSTEKTTTENTYSGKDKDYGTLADRQTVRDVERLFGRPLRMAGASLADQKTAVQLIPNGPIESLSTEGEQARKDRKALKKIADVAIEVLISSRPITVMEISGDKVYDVPDIQATAIRLSDAAIIGQATSSDIIGKDRYAANIVRNFDVREIAEATALALMEDMLLSVPEE